jgi:hypothetical protein
METLRAVVVDKQSPFLGEACALCKQPFAPGDELAICPVDATRHHVHCWRAYGNRCTAYGCTGRGEIVDSQTLAPDTGRPSSRPQATVLRSGDSKVQTLPASGFHCAQSCLLLAIAIAIILFAIGCFGLWAIADYIMMEVLGWQYRAPMEGALPLTELSVFLSSIWLWLFRG